MSNQDVQCRDSRRQKENRDKPHKKSCYPLEAQNVHAHTQTLKHASTHARTDMFIGTYPMQLNWNVSFTILYTIQNKQTKTSSPAPLQETLDPASTHWIKLPTSWNSTSKLSGQNGSGLISLHLYTAHTLAAPDNAWSLFLSAFISVPAENRFTADSEHSEVF